MKIFNLGLNCNIYCFSPVLYLCNYNNREYLNSLKRGCRSVPRQYVFCLYMRHKIFTLIISFVTVSAIARVAPNTFLPFCSNADSLETVERIDTSKNTAQLPFDPATELWDPDDKLLVEACLKILTDEERQIVVLHAVAGMKHRQIGEFLSLPLSTVLSKYHRSIKKMRTHLGKE